MADCSQPNPSGCYVCLSDRELLALTAEYLCSILETGIPSGPPVGTQDVNVVSSVTLTVQGTVSTKNVLTGSAPSAASVGVVSAAVVAANAARKGLVLTNTSLGTISLGLDGNAAVLNSGITLNARGGTWVMDEYTYTVGAITAIAAIAASNLAIQELT